MEILFVLLVIALVVSFAVPAIRSVRYDVYNSRAKAALKKLAEARRSYYQQTKGSDISGGFGSDVSQLFACGFLDWRDFVDLPYNFIMCGTSRPIGSQPCIALDGSNMVYAAAMGIQGQAGSKYESPSQYFMSIGADMQVRDNLE